MLGRKLAVADAVGVQASPHVARHRPVEHRGEKHRHLKRHRHRDANVLRGSSRVMCSGREDGARAEEPVGRRAAMAVGVAGLVGVAWDPRSVQDFLSPVMPNTRSRGNNAWSLGPTDVILDNISFTDEECSAGSPANARCILVKATSTLKSDKPAYNGEVFGRVRYKGDDDSALYGDYAEASDAGKIGDIDEVPPGKSEVSFRLLLSGSKRDAELTFTKFKIRVYPGIRKDFRIMKPVSETLDTCDPDYDICD
mmetsp:Transcript_13978/g.35256  ORF Transcript_13978/g.35256 Transcript_13978/m.35256 type:complete len:253 (+) Transcript_13978:974-1732(+)